MQFTNPLRRPASSVTLTQRASLSPPLLLFRRVYGCGLTTSNRNSFAELFPAPTYGLTEKSMTLHPQQSWGCRYKMLLLSYRIISKGNENKEPVDSLLAGRVLSKSLAIIFRRRFET
jgi:hypothetical protein